MAYANLRGSYGHLQRIADLQVKTAESKDIGLGKLPTASMLGIAVPLGEGGGILLEQVQFTGGPFQAK